MYFPRAVVAVVVSLGIGMLLESCATPYPQPTMDQEKSVPAEQADWPRVFESGHGEITVYRPLIEEQSGTRVLERAAVSIQTPQAARPIYGLIWISAKYTVQQNNQLVTFDEVSVSRSAFPSATELAEPVLDAVRQNTADLMKPEPLPQFQSSLAIAEAESGKKAPDLKNSPPRILLSTSPALLVLIDGKPALRAIRGEQLLRVINTRALILLDRKSGKYFFYMGDRWMEAPAIEGPWAENPSPPASLEKVKKAALAENGEVDLLDRPGSALMTELANGVIPKIQVATQPTELIQTRGKPDFQSIEGTHLLFAENTDDNLFLDQTDQKYYVLLSGRWYRAKSLQGPWGNVSARSLPADFALIPKNHRKGAVLASVAGTPQAGEAAASNQVPQTAVVDRLKADLKIQYDGTPRFKPIQGTSLRYAINTPVPVIQVAKDSFYAVRAGVWFQANSPAGPWKVAETVPAEIYRIPPSSPLYYVTFVRIYNATPQYVFEGYTPGYLGSFYSSDGVVVYGTGYYYTPWIGSIWIGPALTFGFYPWWGPWWGPWYGWVGPYYYPYGVVAPPTPAAPSTTNLYTPWSSAAALPTNPQHFNQPYVAQPGWGAIQPQAHGPSVAPWNPPSAPSGGGGGGNWGPAVPMAPPAPAPAPAPVAPGGGIGHAGAAGQAFPGGGWGPKK